MSIRAGQAELSPDAETKLGSLAKALADRPRSKLEPRVARRRTSIAMG